MKALLILLALCLTGYLILFFMAEDIQRKTIFPGIGSHTMTIPDAENIYLKNSDEEKIAGVFIYKKSPVTVLYFHGNGGNLNLFKFQLSYITDILGYNALSFDYPGYGESQGKPTESKVYEAGQLFYDYRKDKIAPAQKNKNTKIILLGESIGTAGAIDVASNNPVDGMILINPFTSTYDMATLSFGFNIAKFLFLDNQYINIEKIRQVMAPTIVVSGGEDKIISSDMGKQIFAASMADHKYLFSIPNAAHNGILQFYGDKMKKLFQEFVKQGKLPDTKRQITIK